MPPIRQRSFLESYGVLFVAIIVSMVFYMVVSCATHDTGLVVGGFGAQTEGDAQRGGAAFIDGTTGGVFAAVHTKFGSGEKSGNREELREIGVQLAALEATENEMLVANKQASESLGGLLSAFGPTGIIGAAAIGAAAFFMRAKKKA